MLLWLSLLLLFQRLLGPKSESKFDRFIDDGNSERISKPKNDDSIREKADTALKVSGRRNRVCFENHSFSFESGDREREREKEREVWLWFMMILLWLPVCRQRGGPYNIVAAIWAPSLRALHYHFDAWFSETTFSLRGLAESWEAFGFDLNSLSESCFLWRLSKCNKGFSARIILETFFFLQCAIIMDFGALVIIGN